METIHALGVDIAYERVGAGPPLVLLHGAGEDSRVWQPQLAALQGERCVVAWDEPGSGRSSDLPGAFALSDYADCLAALIEAIGLGPAAVAGLSWGGTVALELYRRHPRLVSSLILADTYAGWRGSLSEAAVRARVEGVARTLAESEVDPGASDRLFPDTFAHEPSGEVLQLLHELAAALRPETLAQQLRIMASADLSDLLPHISVPTLLIWGDRDARSPLGVARAFERAIAGSELVVIRDCGHCSHLERPEAFTSALRDFCRDQA